MEQRVEARCDGKSSSGLMPMDSLGVAAEAADERGSDTCVIPEAGGRAPDSRAASEGVVGAPGSPIVAKCSGEIHGKNPPEVTMCLESETLLQEADGRRAQRTRVQHGPTPPTTKHAPNCNAQISSHRDLPKHSNRKFND